MTVSSRRSGANTRNRCGGLAVALGVGLAAATGHGVAWADTTGGDSTAGSVGHSDSTTGAGDSAGPRKSPAAGHDAHRGGPTSSESGSDGAKTTPTHTDAADGARDGTPTKTRKSAVGQPSTTGSEGTSGKDDAASSGASASAPEAQSGPAAPQHGRRLAHEHDCAVEPDQRRAPRGHGRP
jgi:hypothetical protein